MGEFSARGTGRSSRSSASATATSVDSVGFARSAEKSRADGLRFDVGSSCQLRLGQVEGFAAFVQHTDHRIDRVDPSSGALIGCAALGISELLTEVALRPCSCVCHPSIQ